MSILPIKCGINRENTPLYFNLNSILFIQNNKSIEMGELIKIYLISVEFPYKHSAII